MLVRQILRKSIAVNKVGVLSRAAYHGGHTKEVTMNDLPVPSGDWHEQYARKNAKYNAWLIFGILSFVGTVSFARATGTIHLNMSPPDSID